jgi:hypothetical protein
VLCMNTTYPSDLSDTEWKCLQPYLHESRSDCRPRRHPLHGILNAIFYVQSITTNLCALHPTISIGSPAPGRRPRCLRGRRRGGQGRPGVAPVGGP